MFQARGEGAGDVSGALMPAEPIFDESEFGGHVLMLADPESVRQMSGVLDGLDPATLFAGPEFRRQTLDPEYLAIHLELLRACYRAAAENDENIAVVIG